MANVFGILSAIVLAATAFFALKNKAALEDQLTQLSRQEADKETNQREFNELTTEAQGFEAEAEEANAENTTLSSELEAQLATNKGLQSEVDDKKSVAESKAKEVSDKKEMLAPLGDLDQLANEFKKLKTDLATLNGELLQKDTEISTRTSVKNALETENESLSSVIRNYAEKKSNPNLKASVTRVVSDLGFVILSGGDNAGIIRDSTLDVVRNGEVIGKLKVTGTEPSSAAANIVPDSFDEGMSVRTGDTVVASDSK
ncbi:MAG: hypothetical protein Q7Q71_08080 [Verrucomicrobiota bacterium JB023]|nr:hypothetical protein [Verrucomicrobiota bacterium JB023]